MCSCERYSPSGQHSSLCRHGRDQEGMQPRSAQQTSSSVVVKPRRGDEVIIQKLMSEVCVEGRQR